MAGRSPILGSPTSMPTGGRSWSQRGAIVRALRRMFAALDFVEVETPALQVSPGNETHLHAFATELVSPGGTRDRRLSAHLAGIRLQEAAGRRRAPHRRVRPRRSATASAAPLHHPEFTLIEWYRAHGRYELLMDDCMAVIQRAAHAVATRRFSYREPHRRSLRRARAPHGGGSVPALRRHRPAGDAHRRRAATTGALRCWPHEAGVDSAIDDTWGDIFSRVLVEKIEPHLGIGRADHPRTNIPP